MKIKVFFAVLIFLPFLAKAQNDAQISHQLFNRVYYNPSAAGASQFINGTLIGRQQWVGFPKAPQVILFSADGYLSNINSGLGLSVISDKLGYEYSTNAIASYSYHIKVFEGANLSFGLGVGAIYKSIKVNDSRFANPSDPNVVLFQQNDSKISPDFSFGVEFNMEMLTLGASVTHIDKSPSSVSNDLSASRHFYAYGRYKTEINSQWDLVPSLSFQNSVRAIQLELNIMTFYKKNYWLGISYRTNRSLEGESWVGLIGLNITDYLRLGYSYDLNIGSIGKYTSGSHELMLGFRLKPRMNYSRKSPRLFLEY